MPRKTDGIEFELHPSPQKDKDGKPLLYVKLASKKKLTFAQLESYSISHKHMAKGELEACFTKFLNCAALWFHEGYRVETPIGSFAPKLALKREITDPEQVKDSDVELDGVDYQPGKRWHKSLKKWLYDGFRKSDKPNVQQLMNNPQHLEEALEKSTKGGYTTVRRFAYYANITLYSARKQLEAWTQGNHPKLLKTRMGQQFIYTMT
jgi:hypothetical protein